MLRFLTLCFLFLGLNAFSQKRAQLTGVVKDASGRLLEGARVYIARSPYATKSREDGTYALAIPVGLQQVSFSYLGLKTINIRVTLKDGEVL